MTDRERQSLFIVPKTHEISTVAHSFVRSLLRNSRTALQNDNVARIRDRDEHFRKKIR